METTGGYNSLEASSDQAAIIRAEAISYGRQDAVICSQFYCPWPKIEVREIGGDISCSRWGEEGRDPWKYSDVVWVAVPGTVVHSGQGSPSSG